MQLSLCLRKFLWKFRHSFSCTTTVAPPILQTLHRKVDGFVKQIGHYYDHSVSIRRVMVLVEGGQTHLILSAIALTPSFHLVRFAASYSPNPILFKFSSTCSSISALAFLDFAAHSLQASMPSLERYQSSSIPGVTNLFAVAGHFVTYQ